MSKISLGTERGLKIGITDSELHCGVDDLLSPVPENQYGQGQKQGPGKKQKKAYYKKSHSDRMAFFVSPRVEFSLCTLHYS